MTNLRFNLRFQMIEYGPLTRVLDSMNIFLSLNIVCSNLRIISFCINERIKRSILVFVCYFFNMLNSGEIRSAYLLALGNGPKNRTKAIRRLNTHNLIRCFYTTPTSPQSNLAESFSSNYKKCEETTHLRKVCYQILTLIWASLCDMDISWSNHTWEYQLLSEYLLPCANTCLLSDMYFKKRMIA